MKTPTVQDQAKARLLLLKRKQQELLRQVYDWFGDECPCGLALGECREHPRARPSQRPPGSYRASDPAGDWRIWLVDAGRGFGKSYSAAKFVTEEVMAGRAGWVALINGTTKDVRDIQIEHPDSGLVAVAPPWFKPLYEPSKARLTWPNGAIATMYTAEEPEALRGPQFDLAWCVAEGTPIMAEGGYRPIESLSAGDRVWTRDGLRPVSASSRTGRQVPVFRITTECGETLRLTGNHRVWTENRGWLTCDQVTPGDMLSVWKYKTDPRRGSNGNRCDGTGTVGTDITATGPGPSCTSRCGSGSTAGPSLTATRSTTSTRTGATTGPETWNARPWGTTGASTTSPVPRATPGNPSRGASSPAPVSPNCGPPASLATCDAPSVAWSTSQRACGRSSAGAPVARITAARSVEPDGLADVWDLKVEHTPEFIAGNILVHNCDEIAKWKRSQQQMTWDMLMMCLRRKGDRPTRVVVTTTPKPTETFKSIKANPRTVRTTGSTFENAAHLDDDWLRDMREKYGGTRLGRQELEAELLEDTPGALWSLASIEDNRLAKVPPGVDLVRVVVAVDPSAGAQDPESAAECGIMVAAKGSDGHAYLLEDLSVKGGPETWGRVAIDAYRRHRADVLVAETNNGGDMVEYVVRSLDDSVNFKKLWASRGKATRAEPVASLYSQGKVHHVGAFPVLEGQLTTWLPGDKSPDRLDAAVWAITELLLDGINPSGGFVVGVPRDRR